MSVLLPVAGSRPSLKMSEEEFIRFTGEDMSAEWVDGEVMFKMPVEETHDEIQALLRALLELLAKRHKLGKVRGPEFTTRMVLRDQSGVERVIRRDPDVMFIASANLDRMKPTCVDGPADFVIEVVSPDSEFRDFNIKYHEYQSAGVREYWIVSPFAQTLHQFVRNATGMFERRDPDEAGRVRSAVVPSFWVTTADLFAKERPDVITLMQKMQAGPNQ